MSKEGELLLRLISQDFEVSGSGRWYSTKEHSSLVIDFEKGLWYWNSRSMSGNAYTWLTKVKGFPHTMALEVLKTHKSFTDTFIHTVRDSAESVVYPKLVDIFYENGQLNDKGYWTKRGYTENTIQRFKLGFTDGWYTIPIYQDGLFRNFQLRRDEPAKAIRSYYKDVGRLLFNSDILKYVDTVYLTEGPTDCIRLLQEGLPAVSHTAGAGGWNDEWFKYFMYQKRIFIIYDNDDAGRLGAVKVARNLGEYRTRIYTYGGFDDKYDSGNFFGEGNTREDFLKLVDNNSYYAFERGKV